LLIAVKNDSWQVSFEGFVFEWEVLLWGSCPEDFFEDFILSVLFWRFHFEDLA
jgi:hypothetical protein